LGPGIKSIDLSSKSSSFWALVGAEGIGQGFLTPLPRSGYKVGLYLPH
jgi:hypothetical protein